MAFYENALYFRAAGELLAKMQQQNRLVEYDGNVDRFCEDLVNNQVAGIQVHLIESGKDKGKMTLQQKSGNDAWSPIPGLVAADYGNLVRKGEDLATAVDRLTKEKRL